MLSDPATLMAVFSTASGGQRLGFVLFYGGAAMVLVSCCMHAVRLRSRTSK